MDQRTRNTVALGSLLLAALLPLSAAAATHPPVGEQSNKWLELQRSNNAALGTVRPLPGDMANEVYQRYRKSFVYPIPESYNRKRFVAD